MTEELYYVVWDADHDAWAVRHHKSTKPWFSLHYVKGEAETLAAQKNETVMKQRARADAAPRLEGEP